jgi:hypothetical protein
MEDKSNQPTGKAVTPARDGLVKVDPHQSYEDLRRENERLREQLGELGEVGEPTKFREPSFGMSEGERQDLINSGVTTSPFTGDQRTASGEGVEPGNPQAERNDARAHQGDADAAGAGVRVERGASTRSTATPVHTSESRKGR